jgi:hypothetical protein
LKTLKKEIKNIVKARKNKKTIYRKSKIIIMIGE